MTQESGKRGRGRPPKAPAPSGEKPNLTDKKWRGLRCELRGCEYLTDWQRDGWPSRTPAQTIAAAAGVTRQMVYRWREDPAYRAGLVWLLSKRLIHRLEDNDRDDDQSTNLNNPKQDEFWVEPDPSLFQGGSAPGGNIGQRGFEMVAEELVEVLGENVLNLARSRAAEFQREGTADQRKFWTRLANVIQELLDRRSNIATSKNGEELIS